MLIKDFQHCRPDLLKHTVKSQVVGMCSVSCTFMIVADQVLGCYQVKKVIVSLQPVDLAQKILILHGYPMGNSAVKVTSFTNNTLDRDNRCIRMFRTNGLYEVSRTLS